MHHQSARFVRSSGTLAAEVNGEVVALSVERGQCYGMNDVASRVWQLLAEPRSLEEICEALTADYDVEMGTCRQEVSRLLEELRSENLVESVSG